MFGYGQRFEALLYGGVAALTGITFISDLLFPLGTAVWVIYLLPVALCYLASRPSVPVVTASVITVLVVAAYFFAPQGVDPDVVRINRVLGALTAWIVAGTGYLFISNKLSVWRQEWLQTGQVGLARSASGDQTVEEVGESILQYLAEYLSASAGAIFIREGNLFRRRGVYGVPSDAPVPASFDLKDGLLGQVVRDRRSFLIEDVPDEYLYYGSGLGQSKPRHLLIAPASADEEINAVVELGFSSPASAEARELLQRVGEPIGIAVRSAEYRARLHELLDETQRQTEELQTQSEELRTANEELEEQRRSLQESQSRLEHQQSELEQTNAQLEEQTQQLENQRDELSRAQGELQVQARNLEQASRYKSDFLANMSHELRTPLNSLLIMAGLLAENRDGNLTPDQVKYATTIETSGNDLLALINDILDISRIEAGRLELQPQPVNIRQMIEKLHSTFQPAAGEKGVEFKTEIAPETPGEMQADPQRIEQVLKNFLSNAVKFTEEGEIALSVDKSGDGLLAFTVRDTGVGIPPDQQETIFEAFRQADSAIDRKYGGTGLGLSICKEMARLLGGDVAVESEVGKGSAFTLVVPEVHDGSATPPAGATSLRASRAEKAPPTARPERPNREERPHPVAQRQVEDDREHLSGDSRTILVVEDDPAFSRILYELAHELGFQCLIAETADEGVLLARQYLPVGVILDVGLPDHTGLSVLDRIKHDVRTRHIPVHIVSVSDHTQTALQFGAMSYLTKPVKRDDLVRTLEGLETELAQRMRRVLVVEDDATQLESLRSLLSSEDIETVGARSAADCLELLKEETFDCMVLDLSLPDASGFDVLETLGNNDSYAFPPPIVYTGRDLTQDEELRLRKFSKSIIIKGAKSPERLMDEVTLFLHQVVSDLPDQKRDLLVRSLNRDAVLEGRSILVVEDDIRNVYALTSVFEPHGATVRIARNGREALDVLDTISSEDEGEDGRAIDLVLMDIMMPEMDGLTATREIRQRPEWKQLPIIALTAKAMADDQEQCLAAGANDYLAKPLDVEKLLSLVRVWMQR